MRSDAGAVLHTKALAMIKRLVLFGATGDLAGRFLLPALAELYDSGQLPADVRVVASARQDWDKDTFRHRAAHLRPHPPFAPHADSTS